MNNFIIADGRWAGQHGIGRFSQEVLSRLQHADIFNDGPSPLSLTNLIWQQKKLQHYKKKYRVYFTPGFNPVLQKSLPFVFTLHDLIHLSGTQSVIKKLYYQFFMKPAARNAYKILTVSEHSKNEIIHWANIPSEHVVNVSCGISDVFKPTGAKYQPGFPYLLHVGNHVKAHKNAARLIAAFSQAKIDPQTRLIFTGITNAYIQRLAQQHQVENRVGFCHAPTDVELAEYYRGASALVFPSLFEGFGLPVVESMASGTPVLTSNKTCLPEVAGNAALLVEPADIDSLTSGIEKILVDENFRQDLIQKGFERVAHFSWEKTSEKVQAVLNQL